MAPSKQLTSAALRFRHAALLSCVCTILEARAKEGYFLGSCLQTEVKKCCEFLEKAKITEKENYLLFPTS